MRLKPVAGLLTLSSLAFVVLIGLGTWQVQRLAEKEALIARVDRLITSEPVAVPDPAGWSALDQNGIAYQPVSLSGVYDHTREIHVFISLENPKGPNKGPGYFVMTPLTLADGHIVWINRGFVPEARKDPATRAEGQVSGVQDISGLMRPTEKPSWLSPAADPVKNVWFVRDPAEMARAAGLDLAKVAPFTVDAFAGESPGGLPQGGETIVSFSNNHLGYAITWYGLAAALVAVTTLLARQRLKKASPAG